MISKLDRPELLSPAGNFEKMEAAFRFGADAVYLSGTRFGMRAAADNFTLEELSRALDYAHLLNKKLYLTLNVMPRQHEIYDLEQYLNALALIPLDAVIVADAGVLRLCRKHIPDIPVHISTQAAVVNAESCVFWLEQGAARAVLARELSLEEIAQIRAVTPKEMELEAFVHGSMCVSFSGRCMLSQYYTGRDANRGECTQPCRWQFHFAEEKRPNDVLTCEIHPEGSYIFGSKDLCMVEHLSKLVQAGIQSFKIEGRMKSAYYAAVTANVYRMALDGVLEGRSVDMPSLKRELDFVSHREYSTGYYFDPKMKDDNLATTTGYFGEKSYLARVISYNEEKGLAICRQNNKFCLSDEVEYLTPGQCGAPLHVMEMFDENDHPILSCPHPQMIFSIQTREKLNIGDLIRKA